MKIKSILTTFIVLLVMLFAPIGHAQLANRVQDIKAAQMKELISANQDMLILDIRTKAEFNEFSLPGSVNIDSLDKRFEENLAAFVASHQNTRRWMVYCRSGNRSAQAMPVLQRKLPGTIYHVKDGIRAYPK